MPRPEFSTEDRRSFMKAAAKQCLGVSFAGAVGSQALFGDEPTANPQNGKAKHIIYMFMDGAMTHLDTFDPKVGVEEAGETTLLLKLEKYISSWDKLEPGLDKPLSKE